MPVPRQNDSVMAGSFPRLLIDCLSIILIDLLLAGDNALVIAMAVRPLPARQRKIGITLGASAAVILRIVITIAAAQLLNIEFIKLLGGTDTGLGGFAQPFEALAEVTRDADAGNVHSRQRILRQGIAGDGGWRQLAIGGRVIALVVGAQALAGAGKSRR